MLELLKAAVKGGFRTSEFWLAALALLVPVIDSLVTRVIDYLTAAQTSTHSPFLIVVLAAASAAISAAYSIARALVKKEQVKQIPTAAVLDGYAVTPVVNSLTLNPAGTAAAEREHALNAGAAANDLPK